MAGATMIFEFLKRTSKLTISIGRRLGFNRFRGDEEGQFALMFAVAIIPVLLLLGGAIDFGRAFRDRTTMQLALDSAVLAAGRAFDQTGETSEAMGAGERFFSAAMQEAGIEATLLTNTADGQGNIEMSAQTGLDTTFMHLLGNNEIELEVGAQSLTSDHGGMDVELAIVFDVTGSMNPEYNSRGLDRLTVAKQAANDLLATMLPDSPQSRSVRISLIPFSSMVNVGDYAEVVTGVPNLSSEARVVQVRDRYTCTRSTFGYCVAGYWTYRERVITTTIYRKNCVAERLVASGHAYDDAPPSQLSFHAFTTTNADEVACTPSAPVVPLTDHRQTLVAAVDDLKAEGGTAGHLGVAWGWYSISPSWSEIWPTTSQPKEFDTIGRLKAMIIMTDGEFNYHYNNSYQVVNEPYSSSPTAGNGTSASQAAQLCGNMKDAGVEVFAVGVELTSDDAREMLEDCVSSPNNLFEEHYHNVADSLASQTGLRSAFQKIAKDIATATGTGNQRLRITR